MEFNPENEVVKLCAQGMESEGRGEMQNAAEIFLEAWEIAKTDFEKFTAAHYMARHQRTVAEKLNWDNLALRFALNIGDDSIKSTLPSLYLNIGKCYEDLNNLESASSNYDLARSYFDYLPENGYGAMIKNGVENGRRRVRNKQ